MGNTEGGETGGSKSRENVLEGARGALVGQEAGVQGLQLLWPFLCAVERRGPTGTVHYSFTESFTPWVVLGSAYCIPALLRSGLIEIPLFPGRSSVGERDAD